MLVVRSFEKGVQIKQNQILKFGNTEYEILGNRLDIEQLLSTEAIVDLDSMQNCTTQGIRSG